MACGTLELAARAGLARCCVGPVARDRVIFGMKLTSCAVDACCRPSRALIFTIRTLVAVTSSCLACLRRETTHRTCRAVRCCRVGCRRGICASSTRNTVHCLSAPCRCHVPSCPTRYAGCRSCAQLILASTTRHTLGLASAGLHMADRTRDARRRGTCRSQHRIMVVLSNSTREASRATRGTCDRECSIPA